MRLDRRQGIEVTTPNVTQGPPGGMLVNRGGPILVNADSLAASSPLPVTSEHGSSRALKPPSDHDRQSLRRVSRLPLTQIYFQSATTSGPVVRGVRELSRTGSLQDASWADSSPLPVASGPKSSRALNRPCKPRPGASQALARCAKFVVILMTHEHQHPRHRLRPVGSGPPRPPGRARRQGARGLGRAGGPSGRAR